MITLKEFLMGRDKEYPLTIKLALNAASTLAAVNFVRGVYGKKLVNSSGYRPGKYNKKAKGSAISSHLTCEAEDFEDKVMIKRIIEGKEETIGEFADWCLDNLDVLEKAGLYMEDPRYTPGWVHLQTRKTTKRVFIPK